MRSVVRALGPLASLLLAACTRDADPSNVSYTLQFPSTAAAVYSDSIQILVFDAPPGPQRASLCSTLVQKRRSGQELGSRLAEVNLGNICDARDQKRPISVDFGERAFLAVAQHGGDDVYIGCSLQSLGDSSLPVNLYLTPIYDKQPPVTTCTSVSQFCSKTCP